MTRSKIAVSPAALADKAKLDDLTELLDQMLGETGGPLTASERRAADLALGVGRKATRKKRVA
jgi:hypothetical protein